jgi:hypothetical protein
MVSHVVGFTVGSEGFAMRWVSSARERARTRLTTARQGGSLPSFQVDSALADMTGRVIVPDPAPNVDDGIPRGVRIAGAWAWRLILFAGTAYLMVRVIALLHLVVIPVAVALLLAAAALTATSTTGAVTDLAVRAGSPRSSGGRDTSSAETAMSDAGPPGEQPGHPTRSVGGHGADEGR